MPHEGGQLVRIGTTLIVTKQDDDSFKVQRSTNLELVGIADLKSGNQLTFRNRARIAGMFCSVIDLSPAELKSIGA